LGEFIAIAHREFSSLQQTSFRLDGFRLHIFHSRLSWSKVHGWKLFRLFALELIPPRPPQSTLDEASSGDFFYLESFNWTLTQFHLINLHLALFSKLFCLINHLSLSTSLASRGSQTERYEGKRESDEGKYFPSADNIFVAELSRERQRGSLSVSLCSLTQQKAQANS
jgi:hypothetical protein